MSKSERLIRGGQGRSDSSLSDSALAVAGCGLGILFIVVVLAVMEAIRHG